MSFFYHRKIIAKFLEELGEKVYHPKHLWTISIQKYLKSSLDFTKFVDTSKQDLFLSHPVSECSCSLSAKSHWATVNVSSAEKKNKWQRPLDDLETCPQWMESDVTNTKNGMNEDNGSEVIDDLELSDAAIEGEAPVGAEMEKVEKEDNQGDADDDTDAND